MHIPQPQLLNRRATDPAPHLPQGEMPPTPPDPPYYAIPGQPTRANLIGWMRTNLALMIFAFGLVSGGITTLVTTTAAVTRTQIRMDEQADDIKNLKEDLQARVKKASDDLLAKIQANGLADTSTTAGLQGSLADLDRRFTASETRFIDLRHARDAEISDLGADIKVLKSQMAWFRDSRPAALPMDLPTAKGPRR